MSAARTSSSAEVAASGRVATPTETVRRTSSRPGPGTRCADPVADALAHPQGALGAGVGQHDGELVAAEAGDDVGLTRRAANHPGGLDQRPAAGQVAVRVVDALEAVEVDEQQRQRPAAARRPLGLATQHLVQIARVVQLCEVVGDRERLGPPDSSALSSARAGPSSTSPALGDRRREPRLRGRGGAIDQHQRRHPRAGSAAAHRRRRRPRPRAAGRGAGRRWRTRGRATAPSGPPTPPAKATPRSRATPSTRPGRPCRPRTPRRTGANQSAARATTSSPMASGSSVSCAERISASWTRAG